MSMVVFWSPVQGRSGSSTLALASALTLGFRYRIRQLLTHLGCRGNGPEQGLSLAGGTGTDNPDYHFSNHGWDAMQRMYLSRSLTKYNFCSYTLPMLEERLDVLMGIESADFRYQTDNPALVNTVMDTASQYYELVIVDLGSGMLLQEKELNVMKKADLVVVSLTQNTSDLDIFFSQEQWPEMLAEKEQLYTIPKYDITSRFTAANIRRRYDVKQPIYTVPYHTDVMDSWNRKDMKSWVQQNMNSSRVRSDWQEGMHDLTKMILENSGLQSILKQIERGA
ncbi:hypothetical protein Q5741_00680 [Paenibacillus sp. JX-17]|uniref:ParA family protein n=1 Tax=Paenibacillus lacisoli TaxID=3064525 RepID=A0ABT9C6N6_9BACL|nr:hypothetical protein [Paenibacillus sp. JX-17]MDO7904923.1 hypothetical protein [Paenibacillus sp. JX-17]